MADRDFCGIVFIMGGSSWAWADTPEDAARLAAKQVHKDWGKFLKVRGRPVSVNIYDMRGRKGWVADERGVVDSKTDEVIKRHSVIEVE